MSTKILLALDGSATSMKAAEHIGKIICSCASMEITLYHVISTPPELSEHAGGTTASVEDLHRKQKAWVANAQERVEKEIFGAARSILKENGVDEKTTPIRSKIESESHPDAALAIVEEAHAGGYDVVVMGKRGTSMLKDCIIGSVTWKVVHNLLDCVIWIVE